MLSLKTNFYVPTVRNKQQKLEKNNFYWRRDRRDGSGYGSKDLDLKPEMRQNVTDPEHCHKENLTLENMFLHFSVF
jgi:hypothetical protein